jgi:hypothetical protein
MHEAPIDRAIQLKTLIENAQLHNHIVAMRREARAARLKTKNSPKLKKRKN